VIKEVINKFNTYCPNLYI